MAFDMAVEAQNCLQKDEPKSADAHGLLEKYGPLIGGADLHKVLGYKNWAAFRQAEARGHLPIQTFSLPSRRGRFAFTRDVSHWLEQLQVKLSQVNEGDSASTSRRT